MGQEHMYRPCFICDLGSPSEFISVHKSVAAQQQFECLLLLQFSLHVVVLRVKTGPCGAEVEPACSGICDLSSLCLALPHVPWQRMSVEPIISPEGRHSVQIMACT